MLHSSVSQNCVLMDIDNNYDVNFKYYYSNKSSIELCQ